MLDTVDLDRVDAGALLDGVICSSASVCSPWSSTLSTRLGTTGSPGMLLSTTGAPGLSRCPAL